MQQTKWGGAKEPKINYLYVINNREFSLNMFLKMRIDRSRPQYFISDNQSGQKYYLATCVLGDSYSLGYIHIQQ